MVKHWGHLSDQTHWVLFGMAKLAGLIPGATCLVLYLSTPSYILLISLAGTGHSLCCIFGMNNIYGVGILEMANRLENW